MSGNMRAYGYDSDPQADKPVPKRVKRERDVSSPPDVKPSLNPSLSPLYQPEAASSIISDGSADFTIISSDNHIIRVRSYYLLANSPYFRALEQQSQFTSPLRLASYSRETIEDVLHLMTRNPINWSFEQNQIPRIKRLQALCRFLQCGFLMEQITSLLTEMLTGKGKRAFDIFLLAAIALDDPQLCWRALPIAAKTTWSSNGSKVITLSDGVKGCSKLDVTAMPISLCNSLPTKYLLALARAYKLRGCDKKGKEKKGSEGDWDKVASEFYRLVKA